MVPQNSSSPAYKGSTLKFFPFGAGLYLEGRENNIERVASSEFVSISLNASFYIPQRQSYCANEQ